MQNQNEADSKNQSPSSPKTLGQILDQLPSPPSLDSTSRMSSDVSSTTSLQKAKPAPIGKPLSEHGLETLRSIAKSVNGGNLLDDQALRTLLVQHFESRLAIREVVDHN